MPKIMKKLEINLVAYCIRLLIHQSHEKRGYVREEKRGEKR